MAQESGEADPTESDSRAILTVRERVWAIADMMAELQWNSRKSIKALALKWDCSESTVRNYSAEAHRMVVDDKDTVARDISIGARRLYLDAITNGDAKSAKMMGDLWADIAGAKAPVKQELDAKVSGSATPAEAARLVREAFGDKVISSGEPSEPEPVSADTSAD